ncbi:DUF2911 domain-containing protein [Rubrivirga sp.]|uniref:DUF2911 domain-containing protein n=1 Tax=Rubrivirga sp. TaxID=1885344 RepID=UPI003C7159F8
MRPLVLAAALLAAPAFAQTQLATPRASPYAEVSQTVGLTDLEVAYHRPAVNGRRVWGDLVPYGEVWRAGANENTVFETSTDILIEGQMLPGGRYGLHMIPREDEWTVMFSTTSSAWGSYSYDPSEDAVRVDVTPRASALTERLSYHFDDPSDTSTTLVLAWADLEVPISITVDTPRIVLANMETELRGLAGFFWQGWDQAARYALDNDVRLEDATSWAERSREISPTFGNTMTLANLLEATGDFDGATSMRDEAFTLASEDDVRAYARERRRAGQPDQADAALARIGDIP